jgi:hypothetical protein
MSEGQLILAISVDTPWPNDTHPTLPSQKLPESVLSGMICAVDGVSNITFHGCHQEGELPHQFSDQNIPLSETGHVADQRPAQRLRETIAETKRAKNILPFM